MKIIQKGNLDFADKPLKFSCKNCYTIFEAYNRVIYYRRISDLRC